VAGPYRVLQPSDRITREAIKRVRAAQMVTVQAAVLRTSEKAALLDYRGPGLAYAEMKQVWAPRSVMVGGAEIATGAEPVSLRRWFADKHCLPIIGKAESNESKNA
jgi:hypothetical protein